MSKHTPPCKWKTIDFGRKLFQKDFRSSCFSANSLTAQPEENGAEKETQLKLVLMESMALHYSELSR